ncbi:MAG: hypothetical protein ABR601_03950, partial [Parasphingopyxis sp.]|nr:hypothetical protein [Sphingomonadales bacterium]
MALEVDDEFMMDVSRSARVTRGTVVRIMSSAGLYWRESTVTEHAIYAPSSDLIFSAFHFDESAHKGEYYSEFDDPNLEEVRLLASLTLPIGWDGGIVSLYPHPLQITIPEFFDFRARNAIEGIRALIVEHDFSNELQARTVPP